MCACRVKRGTNLHKLIIGQLIVRAGRDPSAQRRLPSGTMVGLRHSPADGRLDCSRQTPKQWEVCI